MSAELVIYGATYGPRDVTGIARNLRKDQSLSFVVSNDTFGGDPWHGIVKSFVLVYKYDTTNSQVQTLILSENQQCVLKPPPQSKAVPKDRLDTTHLKAIQQASTQLVTIVPQPLVILGAAFGLKDVTVKANQLISTSTGKFNQLASNDVWGDGWPGYRKTLVVVYEYDDLQMLDVVEENQRMYFIASPPITIFRAAYGLHDVTNKVSALVRNRSLTVTANNQTFDDGWPGHRKILAVMYQYGEEIPKVATAEEDNTLKILYAKADNYVVTGNPNNLTILGAAYGPANVTEKVQSLVKTNKLQITVGNALFGFDPWPGVVKSLEVVYQYGRNPPLMKIEPENNQMMIDKVVLPPTVQQIETNNLLSNGDVIALSVVSGNYISCDSNNKLVATQAFPCDECSMIIEKSAGSNAFKIQFNGQYVVVQGASSALYATGSEQNATLFSISISTKGGLRLVADTGMYVTYDSSDNSLRATAVDQNGAGTIFGIAFKQTADGLSLYMLNADSLSECELAMASFIWQLTGGFFLAIGLGPFISTGKVAPGILGLIKSNPTAWKAIQGLMNAIISGVARTGTLVASLLGAIGVLYHEGLLWKIFKIMLKISIWIAATWALAKIIEFVFLPEVEAAELLASFTIWSVQTTIAGLDVGQACN